MDTVTLHEAYCPEHRPLAECPCEKRTLHLGDEVPIDNGAGAIPIAVWRRVLTPEGEDTGRVYHAANRPVGAVYEELCERLVAEGLEDEYLSISGIFRHRHGYDADFGKVPFPGDWRWLACYAVTGANEGHYVHVSAVYSTESPDGAFREEMVFRGKTFLGLAHAQKIAARCAELLGA